MPEVDVDGPAAAQQRNASPERTQRWNFALNEFKRAIESAHTNLGHPLFPELIRALRVGNASVATRASKLFKCDVCRREQSPKIPMPSPAAECVRKQCVAGFGLL